MAPLILALVALSIIATLSYIGGCYVSPFGPCWWCRNGCLYCHGTGLRARLFWRVWAFLAEIHRDSAARKRTH